MKRKENFQWLPKELHQLKYEAISVPQGSVRFVKQTQERKSSNCYLLITKGVTSSSPVSLKTRRERESLRTFCSSEFLFNSFVECAASPEVLTDGGRIQMDVVQGVTLLTASNWEVWKVEARVSLVHYGAWEFIEKEEERSYEEVAKLSWKDRSDLKLRKDRAFTLIYQSVSNEFKPLISSTTEGAEEWKILREHFEPTTRARIIQLLDEFFGTRYVSGENLGLFICGVKRSAECLKEVGHDLPPLYQGYQMIRNLPDDFRSTVQANYRWSDKDFVPDKVEAELLLEENRLGVVKKDLEDVSTFAFSDEVKRKMKQKSKFKSKNVNVNSSSSGKSFNQVVKNFNAVIATSKNKSVHGLPELSGLTQNCIPCKLAKSRRVSFKPIGKIMSKRALELLHMDLCGPLPVASQGGNRFLLGFREGLKGFLKKKLISVRNDCGLEFFSGEFRVFLEGLGIDHEQTNSYSPELNGVAERYKLMALDGIKTLLNESGISQKFWAEALICFSCTWNRVCHKGCKKTPFELYGGKRPSVSHLKRFGCLAFVGVPKQLRRKLHMRTKLGMLGYALSTNGYRIWLIEENKVVEIINIRFDDGKRGVDSENTFTGPVRNYLLKDFPEDGDIFSAVGDRADHPEAGRERDTRPGGADSESQTGGTHTLRPCASIPWIRKPVERNDRSRTDIYYFVEGSNIKLRSFNEEKANLAEVLIPKTYTEATRTPEAVNWEGAMDKEMQVMYDRKVWNLVEPPKEAKVLGYDIVMFGETKKDLDNGITLLRGHFDLKILGKTKKLLGIEFEETRAKLYIHQSSYIEKLCKQYERFKFPVSSLPISKGLCVIQIGLSKYP
ncbi:retrovirus-related Pol polyprotein from transposon TNT 1-94 [Trichonephila clavipes]|nr:retrovirus-related Pol polyprotein from transposon TNT 1-94 [Trichonephila clavipes]